MCRQNTSNQVTDKPLWIRRAPSTNSRHPAAINPNWLDDRHLFLTSRCPVPLNIPFTETQTLTLKMSRQTLRTMIDRKLIRHMLRNIYVATQARDDINLRATTLSLIVPDGAVITDRSTTWLHGIELLPQSSNMKPPPVN